MKKIRQPGSPVTMQFLEELAVKDDCGCWLWPRAVLKNGYGVLRIGKGKGILRSVHRLAWELSNGPIPNGQWVLHKCDVRRCFNPEHLFLGTQQDNNNDRDAKGRVCHGEDHADAILTAEQVLEIRRRFKDGERKCDLADAFGISRQGIHDVVMHRNWKHLP